MSLVARASEKKSSFQPVPPGMHLARCYRVIDLGTQKSQWQGEVKYQPKIMMSFEVHGDDDSGKPMVTDKGEPMTISKNYTRSLGEKAALRKELATWRGRDFTSDELRGFELKNVLGVWAMISVAKSPGTDGKEYTNITSINPVPVAIKKAGIPEGFNELIMFSIDSSDLDMVEKFSNNVREKIKASPEFQERYGREYAEAENASGRGRIANEGTGFDDMENDIPF